MADEREQSGHPGSAESPPEQTGETPPEQPGEEQPREEESGEPASRSQEPGTGPAASPGTDEGAEEAMLDPSEIDALLKEGESQRTSSESDESGASDGGPSAENLLDQAEADLAAAMAPDLERESGVAPDAADARPFQFEAFDQESPSAADEVSLEALQDVELDLRIELGRTELLIEDVLRLKEGSVVPLDKLAGDPVDILVNGRLIARGEVLVLNDNFCVRVAEILTPEW